MNESDEVKNEVQKPEMKFCRLCAKNKPLKDICDIVLARNPAQNQQIVYKGCKECSVVVHNALLIIKETLDREAKRLLQEAEKKVVTPESNLILPGSNLFHPNRKN